MPPASPGSDSPRGQTTRKASGQGPKRTPRPEAATNGSTPVRGVDGATDEPVARVGADPTDSDATRAAPAPAETVTRTSPDGDDHAAAARSTSGAPTASVAAIGSSTVTDPTTVGEAPAARPAMRERRARPATDPDLVTTGRRKGRRVRRVIRRIDLWSVLKLAIVLYTCLYAAVMATLALLWGLAYSSGQIEKVQSFMADVGMDNYRFYGDQMWRAAAMIGAIGVLTATVITVLTAALINVISEMTGGIRVVVIEEDPPPRRRQETSR